MFEMLDMLDMLPPRLNEVINSPDGRFYISYLPGNTSRLGSAFGSDGPEGETALVDREGHLNQFGFSYFILNGDHREQYRALIDQGFDACYRYFINNQHLKSSWSN